MVDEGRAWAAAITRFWEAFPSGLGVDANTLRLSILPATTEQHEIQGGEAITKTCFLAFGHVAEVKATLEGALAASLVAPDVDQMRASRVLPFLDASSDPRHQALIEKGLSGEASFEGKRERIDEYGWRNFGDLVADHESAFADGKQLVSHYNNQYDAIAGFAFQFLRTGDRRWWVLMEDLARHVVDIDIYKTDGDKAAFNRGLFWHTYHYVAAGKSTHRSYPRVAGVNGGGPAAEHNYNLGLALHYYLTGWEPSRRAAIGLGEWVINMDDGDRTPFRWLSRAPTGLASASGTPLYHGPGRAGGNSINALLVAFDLSGERRFLTKAEVLIRRCIHPEDDIESLSLLDAERRWYYTVFLEALGRYLWRKSELGELDGSYSYARAALLHYAGWMRIHEYPYLEKPEILEFPTETWSAQDIRKSDVLAWAALCSEGGERAAFLDASARFLDDVLNRLPALPTHTYTRPLVLMLMRGYAYRWVIENPAAYLGAGSPVAEWPARSRFVPQKAIAFHRAKTVAAIGGAGALVGLAWLFAAVW